MSDEDNEDFRGMTVEEEEILREKERREEERMRRRFKAWDKETNRWRYDLLINSTGELLCNNSGKVEPVDPSTYEAVFFTGLYDKAEQEIWEGSIVRDDGYPRPFVVKWRVDQYIIERLMHPDFGDSEFGWWMGGIAERDGYDGDVRVDDLEVVGDIYENPELLD